MPQQPVRTDPRQSQPLSAEYPAFRVLHLPNSVDRRKLTRSTSRGQIDDPKVTGRDNDRMELVREEAREVKSP